MSKILVVDNDELILELMNDILMKDGHEVVSAESGLIALDILERYTPDIIFIDLVMPNIDGRKLCKIIRGREKLNEAYVVILSAIAAEKEIDFVGLGADAYIVKGPLDEMSQNILSVLHDQDLASSRQLSKEAIGREGIHPRGVTEELLSVKGHFELILEKMTEGILELTSEGRIVYANPSAVSLIKMPEEKLLGAYLVELFSKDDSQRIERLLIADSGESKAITEESPVRLNEYQVTLNMLTIEGVEYATMVILYNVTERKRAEKAIKSAHNELERRVKERTGQLSNANEQLRYEISERKLAEEKLMSSLKEKEVLLKEIHHRVKNNLQMIDSLINLHCGDITNGASIYLLKESQSRIRSMALVHEKLYQSESLSEISFSEYIRALTNHLFQLYGMNKNNVNLITNLEDIFLNIDTAIPCGLIINELVSNCLKHAFLDGTNGEIRIGLHEVDTHRICLTVWDNGIGIPEELGMESTKSLGLKLVKLFVDEIDGSIEIDRTDGTSFKIVFNGSK